MTRVGVDPLVAVIDADEPDHDICVLTLRALTLPMVTTWPAFTEAMYLLNRPGEAAGRQALFRLLATQRLAIADLTAAALERSAALMDKYADLPMDLADATLVALAEQTGERRIFTLDSDFRIYRIHGRARFDIIPG